MDAKSFVLLESNLTTNVNVVYIPEENIKAYAASGSFETVSLVVGISLAHIMWVKKERFVMWRYNEFSFNQF